MENMVTMVMLLLGALKNTHLIRSEGLLHIYGAAHSYNLIRATRWHRIPDVLNRVYVCVFVWPV